MLESQCSYMKRAKCELRIRICVGWDKAVSGVFYKIKYIKIKTEQKSIINEKTKTEWNKKEIWMQN